MYKAMSLHVRLKAAQDVHRMRTNEIDVPTCRDRFKADHIYKEKVLDDFEHPGKAPHTSIVHIYSHTR